MQQVESQQQQQQQGAQQSGQGRQSKKSALPSKKTLSSDRDSVGSSMSPVDLLDDTINSVIKSHNESSTPTVGHSKKSRSSVGLANALK